MIFSGCGVTTAVGQGKEAVCAALLDGAHAFDVMRRPGRQRDSNFIGAEIGRLDLPESIPQRAVRGASWSANVALATLAEAHADARLGEVDPERIGLVVGGSNFQQRELFATYDSYATGPRFLRPSYALSFLDTDLCGLCTQLFGIRGFAMTVGGASASGQLAVVQAIQAVQAGTVDVCIALGALMDLSFKELHALRSAGALGSERFAQDPAAACRPFDRDRDGFIYGEACGAVVVESAAHARARGVGGYAEVSGWAVTMDGNRGADPSLDGETRVIRAALRAARLDAAQVDYVNPHGTGSRLGDETELAALAACGLSHARINATKSIVGHGLSAAGVVELVATLLQMRAGRLHPSRNCDSPMSRDFNWVGNKEVPCDVRTALKLSFGFGGINTALCLRRGEYRGDTA
jgi:malonyl-ACP decarboxylase